MLHKLFIAVTTFLLFAFAAPAQNYVSGNSIRIYIEGVDYIYEYASDDLMVRLNKDKSQIECILMLETLIPANDSSPTIIADDVFFRTKYPQFRFTINAPMQTLNAGDLQPEPYSLPGVIMFQGIRNDEIFPTVFTPHNQSFKFRSDFDFTIQGMEGTLPRKYMTMLTGNIRVLVLNAAWLRPLNNNLEKR